MIWLLVSVIGLIIVILNAVYIYKMNSDIQNDKKRRFISVFLYFLFFSLLQVNPR